MHSFSTYILYFNTEVCSLRCDFVNSIFGEFKLKPLVGIKSIYNSCQGKVAGVFKKFF